MTAAASGASPLAAHVRLIRAAADLLEQAGIPGLALCPDPGEIVIQVPQSAGDLAARTRAVARLAALTAGEAAPGAAGTWVRADGAFAGYPVRVYTAVNPKEEP